MQQKSLRLRLLLLLSVGVCLLWGSAAAWMFSNLRHELLLMLDNRLIASTQMVAGIAGQMSAQRPAAQAEAQLPALQTAPDWLSVIARDGVACEVSLVRGEVQLQPLARTAGSPDFSSAPAELGFGHAIKGGKPWRTYVLELNGLRITTADRLDVREHLVRSMAFALLLPFVLVLLGGLALTWWSLNLGLRPLQQLRQALAQRPPRDPCAITVGQDIQELAPLVHTLNDLLTRMDAAIEHERRWSADAAHELRTPLAAIKTHVQVAQLQLGQLGSSTASGAPHNDARHSLEAAHQGIDQLHTTLEQLLLLARVESGSTGCCQGAAITQALQQAIAQVQQAAKANNAHACGSQPAPAIDADLPALANDTTLALPPALLTCAVRNLLDNAVQHHRGNQPIELRLQVQADALHISVHDQGPGLTPEQCTQALQRFWRHDHSRPSSGLGLPVVQRIAHSAGGHVQLSSATTGGLVAQLCFPIKKEAAYAG